MPANDYYDSTGAPSTSSTISSSTLRAEFDAIETGFTAVQAALALKASLASPTLVTPNLGTPSAGVATNLTGTAAGLTAGNVKLAWTIKTTTYTAVAGDAIMADTNSAAFTITLPASPAANDVVDIVDYRGTFGTNNLTIARNSLKIMGLSEDMTVSVSNARFRLVYIDTTVGWRIV